MLDSFSNLAVLQDVICNGHSPFHHILKHSRSKSPHHETISVKIIKDRKTSRFFCTQTEPQKHGECKGERMRSASRNDRECVSQNSLTCLCATARRPSTVNGEFILPKMAVSEDLQHSVHRAEEQTHQLHCTASYIHSNGDVTRPDQRKTSARKIRVKKSTPRT